MEEDDSNRVEQPTASAIGNDEIKPVQGNFSGKDSENELLSDILEGKLSVPILKNNSQIATPGEAQIDTPQGEEDEYEDDFELDLPNPSSDELAAPVYGQSSQDVLTTFDFTKLPPTKDENENPLSIPATPPELTYSEVISVNIINNMKRDPVYAAIILTTNGHKGVIDTILALREDSASLACKEEAITAVFDEIRPGKSFSDASTKKSYTNRPYLHEPEPGWLTHDFLDLLTSELRKLRIERAEQKWSDDNAGEMQTLNKDVHSVDEVRAGEEFSNSGSEPSLNYSEGLKGGITSVPASSLIPENEDDTTDIIATEDNTKLLNFCYKAEEDEIVNFLVGGGSNSKPPKSSIVHCLAGVQELPEFLGPTVSLNLPESNFGYSTTENKRMLNMGQQTDSEPGSPRGGVRLGDSLNVLNEENAFPDIGVEPTPFDVVLPPNRPTTPSAVKPEDSDGELNPFHYTNREDSDNEDNYVNNYLSTIAGILAEKKASEEKDTTIVVEEGKKINLQAEYLVPNQEAVVTGESKDDRAVLNNECAAAVIANIEDDTYADDFLSENETSDEEEEISKISNPMESESPAPEENVDQPADTETPTSTNDEEGNLVEDYIKCGANFTAIFPTNTGSIFHNYVEEESSNAPEDIPEVGPPDIPKVDKAAEVKKKYFIESMLDVIAAERGLEAEEEPETSEIPAPKIDIVKDKNALRDERIAKAKKYSAAQSSKQKLAAAARTAASGKVNKPATSSAAVAGPSTSGKVNKPSAFDFGTRVNAQVSPIIVRKPTSTNAGKTVREPSKAKIKPALTDASTSAVNFLNNSGPSASGVEAEKSGAGLPSASGASEGAPTKSRIRKCSTGPAVKPKTRSKPIRPITQPPVGYAQKRRDGSQSRPTTSAVASRPRTPGASKDKEEPRPSTSKKSGKPVWK